MGKYVYMNGDLVEMENAKISIFDHGLLYGDGVFEGIQGGDVSRLNTFFDQRHDLDAGLLGETPPCRLNSRNGAAAGESHTERLSYAIH